MSVNDAPRAGGGGIGRGRTVVSLEISGGAWLVDPATGREGAADLVISDGVIDAIEVA